MDSYQEEAINCLAAYLNTTKEAIEDRVGVSMINIRSQVRTFTFYRKDREISLAIPYPTEKVYERIELLKKGSSMYLQETHSKGFIVTYQGQRFFVSDKQIVSEMVA